MSTRLNIVPSARTKVWLYGICLVTVGIILSAFIFVTYPRLYLAISDSLNWRLGTPSVLQARLETTLRAVHLRGDMLIDDQSILLLGDSHLHSFPLSLLGGTVVNYSIAGEMAENLAERIAQYKSIGRVKQIVLLTGRNDLTQGRSPQAISISIGKVLDEIPTRTRVAIAGIPPKRHAGRAERFTQEANHLLEALCSERAHCLFIDTQSLADATGALRADFAMADGVHLTSAGYNHLANLLMNALHVSMQSRLSGAFQ